jgi:hypothetical protein
MKISHLIRQLTALQLKVGDRDVKVTVSLPGCREAVVDNIIVDVLPSSASTASKPEGVSVLDSVGNLRG